MCVRVCRLTHRLRVLVSLVEVAMGDARVSACYLQKLFIGTGFYGLFNFPSIDIDCMILANIAITAEFPFILLRDQTNINQADQHTKLGRLVPSAVNAPSCSCHDTHPTLIGNLNS